MVGPKGQRLNTRIEDMAPEQRPRERLWSRGPESLSEAELLAVLLRTGRQGCSAVTEAHALLAEAGGLEGVARMTAKELKRRPGIGHAKAAAVCAALELGRRVARTEVPGTQLLERPEAAAEYLVARLRGCRREVFGFISLDTRHRFITDHDLWEGTRNHVPVDPAEVFRAALLDDAAGVILFHNHPSGETEPSVDDVQLTCRLVRGGRAVGIEVLDHLIIAGPDWVSLRARRPEIFQAGE